MERGEESREQQQQQQKQKIIMSYNKLSHQPTPIIQPALDQAYLPLLSHEIDHVHTHGATFVSSSSSLYLSTAKRNKKAKEPTRRRLPASKGGRIQTQARAQTHQNSFFKPLPSFHILASSIFPMCIMCILSIVIHYACMYVCMYVTCYTCLSIPYHAIHTPSHTQDENKPTPHAIRPDRPRH